MVSIATPGDFPKLTKLAHLNYSRYGGVSTLCIPGRSNPGSSNPRKGVFFEKVGEGLKTLEKKTISGVENTDDGKSEQLYSRCQFMNLQGHGEVKIAFYL